MAWSPPHVTVTIIRHRHQFLLSSSLRQYCHHHTSLSLVFAVTIVTPVRSPPYVTIISLYCHHHTPPSLVFAVTTIRHSHQSVLSLIFTVTIVTSVGSPPHVTVLLSPPHVTVTSLLCTRSRHHMCRCLQGRRHENTLRHFLWCLDWRTVVQFLRLIFFVTYSQNM